MNKDKIIKDLKERNEKLSNQYRLRDIRCVHLEMENADLQEKLAVVNEMNVANYNKYCEELKENKRLKEEYMFLQNASDEYEEKLLNREAELLDIIDKAIKYLKDREEDNECCSVCSVMSDKLLKILGGDVDDE